MAAHADPTAEQVLRSERARFVLTGDGALSSRQIRPSSSLARQLAAQHPDGPAGFRDALRAGLSLADEESQRVGIRHFDLHLTKRSVDAWDLDMRARTAPHAADGLHDLLPEDRPAERRFTRPGLPVRDLRKAREFAWTAAEQVRAKSHAGVCGFFSTADSVFAFGPQDTGRLLGTRPNWGCLFELPLTFAHELEHAAHRPQWKSDAPVVKALVEAAAEYAAMTSVLRSGDSMLWTRKLSGAMGISRVSGEVAYVQRMHWLLSVASWAGIHPVADADTLRSILRNDDPWRIIDHLQNSIARKHGIAREDVAQLIQRDVDTGEALGQFRKDARALGLPDAAPSVREWFDQRLEGPLLTP